MWRAAALPEERSPHSPPVQPFQIAHPPYFGIVRVTDATHGASRAMLISLDDLTARSRSALERATVRRRVEVLARCSCHLCDQVCRMYLTERHTVENTDGEVICSHADLFSGLCPRHRRND